MIAASQFCAASLFDRLARRFGAEAASRGLDLRLVPSTASIRSDPALLAQILYHLVSNALTYTDRGRVLVGCRRRADMLGIEVWDTGHGLPGTLMLRLQGRAGAAGEDVTRGVGLTVVERLCRLLRHQIKVESQADRGTRVVVLVPLAEEVGSWTKSGLVRRRMVVVIDDEEQVLDAFRLLLEAWHFDVVAAPDEDQAIAHLERAGRQPAGIIADYRLREGRTGTEAVRRIRSLYGAAIPSIIITGDMMTDRLGGQRPENAVVLQKPVAAPHLHHVLAHSLEQAHLSGT